MEASSKRSPKTKEIHTLYIPQATMQDDVRKQLKARCFRPLSVNELTENDPENRVESCQGIIQRVWTQNGGTLTDVLD